MAASWLLLAALVLALGVAEWLRNRRRWALAARVPGPWLWLPLFGNLADTIYHYGIGNVKFLDGYFKRYGCVFRVWIGYTQLTISTSHPDDIEAIATNPALIDKGSDYSLLAPWLGDGLLLSGGKKWHARRKLLTPTFHFRILEQFVDVFNDKGAVLVDVLRGQVGPNAVDVRPFISRHALDVICETAMGTAMNAQTVDNDDTAYVRAVKLACKGINCRHVYPWLRYDALFKVSAIGKEFYGALDVVHATVRKVINSRKAELQRDLKKAIPDRDQQDEDAASDIGSKKRMMFIDHLLTMHLQGADLSEQDIIDEVNTFMFEGHDTTMTSVCFTLHLLAMNPAVQERVAEEVAAVIGDEDRFTWAHLGELKYLEAVIKESLRLYPSVPLIFRECKSEFELPSGYTVPAGSSLMLNLMTLHRNPQYFPDPLKFDPERFLSVDPRHHFSYVPFSAGFRNCIGQRFAMTSMKATLARLLRSFRFLPAPGAPDLNLALEVVLTTNAGVPLRLQQR